MSTAMVICMRVNKVCKIDNSRRSCPDLLSDFEMAPVEKSQERWQLINMDVFNLLHNGRSWHSSNRMVYNGVIITRNIRTETRLTWISTRETN